MVRKMRTLRAPLLSTAPPRLTYHGFLAPGYVLPRGTEAETALARAHQAVTGAPLEELSMTADAPAIVRALADWVGAPPGPAIAVAVDLLPGQPAPVSLKLYAPAVDRPGARDPRVLPGALEAYRARLPYTRGTRRMLFATRAHTKLIGRKLLWVPEVRHSGDVGAVWTAVDGLRMALQLPSSAPGDALDSIPRAICYPDLVSLDTDADGVPDGLTVYVANRPGKNRRASSM